MKTCSRCRVEKEESEFNKKAGDRLQPLCRKCQSEYFKQWHSRNAIVRRVKIKENRKERHVLFKEYVDKLKDVPCSDCGNKFPAVAMDFDHKDPNQKEFEIAAMVGLACRFDKLKIELAKCEVVCSNCHRVRTHSKLQFRNKATIHKQES